MVNNLAIVNTRQWNSITKDFRKANSFNVYQCHMVKSGLIPLNHRGRMSGPAWCAQQWNAMKPEDKAVFDKSKGASQRRGMSDQSDRTSAINKVMHKHMHTMAFMEAMGLQGYAYIVDPNSTTSTHQSKKIVATTSGSKFVEVLQFVGLGINDFHNFCLGKQSNEHLNKLLSDAAGRFAVEGAAGTVPDLSPGIQDILRRIGVSNPEGSEVVQSSRRVQKVNRATDYRWNRVNRKHRIKIILLFRPACAD
jgi:hypothetical protein